MGEMDKKKRRRPLGARVLPLGARVLPLGARVLPLGARVLPLGARVLPLGARVLPLGALALCCFRCFSLFRVSLFSGAKIFRVVGPFVFPPRISNRCDLRTNRCENRTRRLCRVKTAS